MKAYNGHPSWSHWNVSLWLANDETLYIRATCALRKARTLTEAAKALLDELPEATPDGARYTVDTVRHALRGLDP